MRGKLLTTVFTLLVFTVTNAQLPLPANLQKCYTKGTRTLTGSPGKNYWQNHASYDINVLFNPYTRELDGKVQIDYINNSPDTLREIVFKLYPNLYKKESPRLINVDSMDLSEGVLIRSLSVNGVVTEAKTRRIDGTNMSLRTSPLAPGERRMFNIDYHYVLNKKSHSRTGEIDPGSSFVAYFFPRIAVYDDVDGWNRIPYLGRLEFYNDFCDFKAQITVPAQQVVWATGDLKNGEVVLQPAVYSKLMAAEQSDQIIAVIDSTDAGHATNITRDNPVNTWRFEAKNVTDFVFACSDHYLWHSSSVLVDYASGRRTRVDAAFNPIHKDFFEVASFAKKTVDLMSHVFPKWPFPYSHETVFDGLDQMEYPMMVNDNPLEDRADAIELTDHEIFHTMFPFYMGINETKYAWMDEGWATIGEWLISPMIDTTIVDEYGISATAALAGSEKDVPTITISTEMSQSYFINAYPKPGLAYLYVKDMLGDNLFYKGLHHYIAEWHGKHPIPFDFFYSMNTGSGKNLNWFWKKWFFETGVADMGITGVRIAGATAYVTVQLKGSLPLPIDLTITDKAGNKTKVHRSVAVWEKGNTRTIIPVPAKNIKEIVMGDVHTPDAEKKDNVWKPIH